VRVNVRLSGSLAQLVGSRQVFDLDEGATVADLLDAVARSAGIEPDASRSLAVVAHGTIVPHEHGLAEDDELDVLVPVAGG
jgi:sulfur carrier protein ThiS